MLRSLINKNIEEALELLSSNQVYLPPFGYWKLNEWQEKENIESIKALMLGWDVTDFGRGDYDTLGATLFTLRNGMLNDKSIGTPYAEKLIVIGEGQRLPLHYHKEKTEDIINKSNGLMGIKLYNVTESGDVDKETMVDMLCDGILSEVEPGKTVFIKRGESITLKAYQYHLFWSEKGHGPLILGEVSSINDDNIDNFNAEPISRFTTIEEDAEIVYPLCNELKKVIK